MSLSEQVAKLEEEKNAWENLCREMMATIILNKVLFVLMPKKWHEVVESWEGEIKRLTPPPTPPHRESADGEGR